MYLIIIAIIVGLELSNVSFRFPIDHEIYVNSVIKNKLTPYVINIGYNLLYLFSVSQIQINKVVKLINPYVKKVTKYLKENILKKEIKKQTIEIIDKNGNVNLISLTREYPLQLLLNNMFIAEKPEGILVSDKNEETGCINKIYYKDIVSTIEYKLSKINFMMIELEHEGKKYIIELKNDIFNYYIVNNSLNQIFFKYYLKNVLKVPVNEDKLDYTVTILDHNINFVTLLPEQYIILNEHDYTILPISKIANTLIIDNITDNITDNNTDERSSSDSDKSDDFVKLDPEN